MYVNVRKVTHAIGIGVLAIVTAPICLPCIWLCLAKDPYCEEDEKEQSFEVRRKSAIKKANKSLQKRDNQSRADHKQRIKSAHTYIVGFSRDIAARLTDEITRDRRGNYAAVLTNKPTGVTEIDSLVDDTASNNAVELGMVNP